jgi:hypothetical protein
MGLVRLGISTPSANTSTTMFTSDNQYLISILATNKASSSPANIRIWVQPSGSTVDTQYSYLVYDLPLDSLNSYETFKFAINQNDVVKVQSTNSSVCFSAYGIVQYDVKLGAGISTYSSTAPINPVDGMIWVNSAGSIIGSSAKPTYVYSAASAAWIPMASTQYVPYSSTAPTSPNQGDLWVDSTNSTSPTLKTYNGSSWLSLGSSVNDSGLIIAQRMFA